MRITEVRIKLTEETDDRLQAFCSVTFDDWFVVRDLKIIEGTNGPFVAMPSRKLTAHCPRCGAKNHLRAIYCNQCGGKQDADRAVRDHEGRAKLYADIAHPINAECREMIQTRVVSDYRKERELSRQPGYVSRYEDEFDDDDFSQPAESSGATSAEPTQPDADPAESRPAASRPAEPGSPGAAPEEAAPEKRTVVDPAASGPRAPHSAGTGKKATRHDRGQVGKKKGGFGSGILDD